MNYSNPSADLLGPGLEIRRDDTLGQTQAVNS